MFSKTRLAAISLIILFAFASTAFQQEERKATNLKVLPKDISHEALEKEMRFYNQSLNVKCNYCHAPDPDRPGRLNFASDSNHMKDETREMMRMTNDINEKNFQVKANSPQTTNVVNCYTCHRGEEMPLVLPPTDSSHRPKTATPSASSLLLAPVKQQK
jgi:hypothetical protein